jgi:hypothetical protein
MSNLRETGAIDAKGMEVLGGNITDKIDCDESCVASPFHSFKIGMGTLDPDRQRPDISK